MGRSNLSERLRKEAEFHDRIAEQDTRWTAFRAYRLSATSIQYAKALVGGVSGKVTVDCGCGDGMHTIDLVQSGATLLAFDISWNMIKTAKAFLSPAAKGARCKLSCQQMAAEEMAYAPESVDIIFGISILHHLELPLAVQEIRRVLKPGGRAIFVEPLNHNPVTKFYRALTPHSHSQTERPLDYSIFDFLKQYFREVQHKEFYLLSLGSAVFALLKVKPLFNWTLSVLFKIDEKLMQWIPWLRRYAWITVIELIK
jgi:SAM-dependent methyltransferase